MPVLNQKYLKVAYPNSQSLIKYQKFKNFGERITRSIGLKKFRTFINRIISVVKPSGKVFIIAEPEYQFSEPEAKPVTILSANLWHDWPRNRRLKERLICFVELIKKEKVDILLLQELVRTNEFEADKWLRDQLGMAYIYSRTNGTAPGIGFEEGLAIFSRYPIKNHRLAQLSDQNNPFSRRMALGTCIETDGGDFLAYSVHLGIIGRQNKIQVSRLKDWVEEESGDNPAVIGGDFNAEENTSQIRSAKTTWHDSYRAVHPRDDVFSHEILWPWGNVLKRSRLDYLFLRTGNHSWQVDEARHIVTGDCPYSDHKPVLLKASFNGGGFKGRVSSAFPI